MGTTITRNGLRLTLRLLAPLILLYPLGCTSAVHTDAAPNTPHIRVRLIPRPPPPPPPEPPPHPPPPHPRRHRGDALLRRSPALPALDPQRRAAAEFSRQRRLHAHAHAQRLDGRQRQPRRELRHDAAPR